MNKPVFRVIVAGHRHMSDYDLLERFCLHFLAKRMTTHNVIIVSGMANGADTLGEVFAKKHNLTTALFPADWNTHGKSAGPKRNRQMAMNADALIAFRFPGSRGTQSMINIATELGLPHRIVEIDERHEDVSYWRRVKIRR